MAVKLRLQRKGRRKAPFYHIVVADSRAPRDGRFIEKIGTYNPLTVPATIELNQDSAFKWLMTGAEPTDTVNAILRFKGVLLRKHLQLGVNKGAITQEQADAKLAAWLEGKDGAINKQKEAVKVQKLERIAKMDGVAKVKAKPVVEEPAEEPATEEATDAATTEETPAADENTAEA
jgi:small subunit ribosomal protein S16